MRMPGLVPGMTTEELKQFNETGSAKRFTSGPQRRR